MIVSSEKKHFCTIVARLYFMDLSSIFRACKQKTESFGGLAIFSDYLPLKAMVLSSA